MLHKYGDTVFIGEKVANEIAIVLDNGHIKEVPFKNLPVYPAVKKAQEFVDDCKSMGVTIIELDSVRRRIKESDTVTKWALSILSKRRVLSSQVVQDGLKREVYVVNE